MFGLGKKKKKGKEAEAKPDSNLTEKPEEKQNTKNDPDNADGSKTKKRKRGFSKKLISIILLVIITIGASGYVVYTIYFTTNDPLDPKAEYTRIKLEHIDLPDEMLEFSFQHFKKLYLSMISFNEEINLLNSEIERIEAIAQKYPDQKQIADKEKKSWEKSKQSLQKIFIKIEKPIKNIYVLFSVNKEEGFEQIEAKKKELTKLAEDALASAREMTQKLKSKEDIPQGFIKGNIYKLKKKFL